MTLIEQNQKLDAMKWGISQLIQSLAKRDLDDVYYYAECLQDRIAELSQDVQQKLIDAEVKDDADVD